MTENYTTTNMTEDYTTTINSKKLSQWQMLVKKVKPKLKKPKVVLGLVVAMVVILSLGLAVIQTQKSQETRSDASVGLPSPDVRLALSTKFSRSHDEDMTLPGLQLSAGNTGLIELKVDPKGLPVIGVELFAQYNPEKIEIPAKRANSAKFGQVAEISKIGNNQIRLLVLISPNQAPITTMVNVGNIQVKLKEPLTKSRLTLLRANFIVDHQSPLRQISGLANDSAIAQGHAISIEPMPTDTPTTSPTDIP